jgi:mono/diheme cytochrome c family protein
MLVRRMMQRRLTIAAIVVALAVGIGCRPLPGRVPTPRPVPADLARGASAYDAYCAGCHGADGAGTGAFAVRLGLRPADLRAPALASASDAALLERLRRGTPLEVRPLEERSAEARAVDALADYLPRLARVDADKLRAGRVVYEQGCAPCHGVYGRADGAIAYWLGAPDLIAARERYSDAQLARVSEAGIGQMPPLLGAFERGEMRALVAYIRHLSDGFAIYDSRCAACHGDDGQGVYSRDLVAPVTAAPPLENGPYPRARLLAMLRRERGVMPHFAALDEPTLRDVIAYVRTFPPPDDGRRPQ